MKMPLPPEPLEARISPAAFYASIVSGVVKNSTNLPITGDTGAADFVGADFALLLEKGDRLYLDGDGNVNTTLDQTLMARVTNGRGMFFLESDTEGGFSTDSFVGLAVSDEFVGQSTCIISGDVVTALTPAGGLARNATDILIQKADIDGLTLGPGAHVLGSILAGGDINNIIGGAGAAVDVAITNEPTAYFGSGIGDLTSEDYTPPAATPGARGASISGIILEAVPLILAADGTSKAGAAGGAGGNVSNVHLNYTGNTNIFAGDGAPGGGSGKGGAGGSVKNVSATMYGDSLFINAGFGGGRLATPGTGGGGAGGSVSNINVTDEGNPVTVAIGAGGGGSANGVTGPGGSGGAGGSVINSSVLLHNQGTVFIGGATGGFGTGGGGGAGGSIIGTSIVMKAGGALDATVGIGGFSEDGKGGAGGSYINDSVLVSGVVSLGGYGIFKAAPGGEGKTGGGAGGIISNSSLRVIGDGSVLYPTPLSPAIVGEGAEGLILGPLLELVIAGGAGGELHGTGQGAAAKPGKGGAIVGFELLLGPGAGLPGGVVFQAGSAGAAESSGLTSASGAAGGAVSKVTVDIAGTLGYVDDGGGSVAAPEAGEGIIVGPPIPSGTFAHINVFGGSGSSAGTAVGSNGVGGIGGAVTGVNIIQHGDYGVDASSSINLIAGGGGDGSGQGKGGLGGALGSGGAPISVRATAPLSQGVYLSAGSGGDGALGGSGGAVNTVNLTLGEASTTFTSAIGVYGGSAGDSATLKGSNGGGVLSLSLVATGDIFGLVDVSGGDGGAAGGTLKGGAGGAVQKGSLTLYGQAGDVNMLGGGGGAGAIGGKGGALSNVALAYFSGVGLTVAGGGVGGGGATGVSTGGNGGAVSAISLRDFGVNTFKFSGGSGGEVNAGTGGGGGAVTSVKLDAALSTVQLTAGAGGLSSEGAGGAGASVASVSGIVNTFSATAGPGGGGTTTGGLGGNVQGINIVVTNRVNVLRAGDGGTASNTGGGGGKVSGVVVVGEIGDFDPDPAETGLGEFGLIAGQGGGGITAGQNGIITGITASRISTIMAGDTEDGIPTASNSVLKISSVKAAVIGVDDDNDGLFDFTNNMGGPPAFDLGTDTPIDGFVLVKIGGVTASSFGGTIPLRLLEA